MKKFLVAAMMATLLTAGSAFASQMDPPNPPPPQAWDHPTEDVFALNGINAAHLFPRPDATAPAPIERTAHVLTVKNAFGWFDALEVDGVQAGDGYDTVNVDVTNCHGFGPLPDPLKMKTGQTAAYENTIDGKARGLNYAQCIEGSPIFTVIDLKVRNGTANVYTRAEYATSIGKDLFDIPELPAALAQGTKYYEFSRVWNGYNGQSTFIAFVNIGEAGNARITAIEDPAGTELPTETVYLPKGDTFYELATKLHYGRLKIVVPPNQIGCPGCTPSSFTPTIYAVIFRGYKGAGVAKAIAPALKTSP
jgi:hypothetical protein